MTGKHRHAVARGAAGPMTVRGAELLRTASQQIDTLIDLLSQQPEAALSLPCPGRENMGDGTIAAVAGHTADRYQQIAEFLHTFVDTSSAGQRQDHRRPRRLRHRPGEHAPGSHAPSSHATPAHVRSQLDLAGLLAGLSAAREALGRLALLTDEELDAVPPPDSFRFCDGQRDLAQVMASLLKHQSHQVDALTEAMTNDPATPFGSDR